MDKSEHQVNKSTWRYMKLYDIFFTAIAPGEKRPVVIDTTAAPKKDAPVKISATTPKGRTTELKTKPTPEGYETTFSSWDKGEHTIKVQYDGKEIPDSPFVVAVEKIDVTKVTVKGLETRKLHIFVLAHLMFFFSGFYSFLTLCFCCLL